MPRIADPRLLALALLAACADAREAPDSSTVASAVLVPSRADAAAPPAVRVRAGSDEELDACSLGAVHAAKGAASAWVAVRGGPGERWAVVDSLAPGTRVFSCDGVDGWVGIVYAPAPGDDGPLDRAGDCGVTSPIVPQRPYAGPCRSGWVRPDAHEVLAG